VLSDASASASNLRELVVLPLIQGVATAVVGGAAAPSVHELTITGERLAGPDVRIAIDDVLYVVGSNGNAGQLVHTLGRQLGAGPHDVSVVVDGVRSRAVELLI
jgi:hypothetical protein